MFQVGRFDQIHPSIINTTTATASTSSRNTLYHAGIRIIKEEGILSFWKGNLTSVIHRFPYSAINFTVYEELQCFIKQHSHETPMTRFLCGATAGAVSCISCYPLDLVRTQLIVSKTPIVGHNSSVYGNISSTIKTIIETEGFSGLYRGLLISLGVTIPTFGISFCVYGTVKEKILNYPSSGGYVKFNNIFKDPHTYHLSTYGSLLSGALSGLASSLLLFPADSIRRRMQVEKILCDIDLTSDNPNCKTSINENAIAEIYKVLKIDGIRGLYRGIVPELLKVIPMVSITFMVYEFTYDYLSS